MATQHLYALVKTSGAVGQEEGGLESDVVGIYGSRALAEKAMRLSTRGYKTIDGAKYHHGSNSTVTTFLIHKRVADELPPGDDDEDERDQVRSPGSFSELARHIETSAACFTRGLGPESEHPVQMDHGEKLPPAHVPLIPAPAATSYHRSHRSSIKSHSRIRARI